MRSWGSALSNMINVLIKRGERDTDVCASRGKTWSTGGTKWPSTSQGKRTLKEPNSPTTWSWISSLQNCEKINFCCLRSPAVAFYQGRLETNPGYKDEHETTTAFKELTVHQDRVVWLLKWECWSSGVQRGQANCSLLGTKDVFTKKGGFSWAVKD